MAEQSRANTKKDRSLSAKAGFILTDMVIMLPVLFSLTAALLLMTASFADGFRDHMEVWLMRSEMRRLMEVISSEIEYADRVEQVYEGGNYAELRISTRKRNYMEQVNIVKYVSFFNNGQGIVYRKELRRYDENRYSMISKQPLNGESTYSRNSVKFICTTLAEGLYLLKVEGYARRTRQTLVYQTVVLKRSPYYDAWTKRGETAD